MSGYGYQPKPIEFDARKADAFARNAGDDCRDRGEDGRSGLDGGDAGAEMGRSYTDAAAYDAASGGGGSGGRGTCGVAGAAAAGCCGDRTQSGARRRLMPARPKDVLEAVYKLPIVQKQVGLVQDEAKRQWGVFKGEWKAAPTGEKVLMVTSFGRGGDVDDRADFGGARYAVDGLRADQGQMAAGAGVGRLQDQAAG